MLQQTQVERVVPRWTAWLERWPTADALAAAPLADVIVAWQGLGYNRRAVALHRAARYVALDGWPADLTQLPGVGRYTADPIRNFAFGERVPPVDTNVRRVQERTGHAFDGSVAQALFDSARPSAWRACRAAAAARSPAGAHHAAGGTSRCESS